jgi:CRISPR-associated protein Csm1
MSNKAARSMKGRSFYMQILMDAVVQRLLREEILGATSAHLIYVRGGKMQMVLANTSETRSTLANIRNEIEATIFDLHKTGLHLWLLDDLVFNLHDVNSGKLWKTLDQKTAYLKGRKLETQLGPNFINLFDPIEEGFEPDDSNNSSPKICSASGDFIQHPNEKENRLNDTADEKQEAPIWVSGIVKQQARLGRNLQDAIFYAFLDFPQTKSYKALLYDALESCLFDAVDLNNQQNIKKLQGAFVKTLNLEQPNKSGKLTGAAFGYQFYGGNKQAWNVEAQRVKQLHELADFDETRLGAKFSRLGVLRMDLDGLGDFLARAQADNPHFGFNATVSARLDLFLSGWLNKIREQSTGLQDWLNITFVGGDDLMVVGHWQACFDFAEAVRADADRFFNGAGTAKSDWSISQPFTKVSASGFTMSAGVSLVGPKFPIAKATALAGDALDAAKNFHKNKNAFNLLGESLSWNGEFDWVKSCKTQMLEFLNEQQLNASFLQQLQLFQKVKNQHLLTERQLDLSFIWHSIYFLSRYEQRMKADNPAKPFVLALRKELLGAIRHNCRMYDLLAVAARWAELENRSAED